MYQWESIESHVKCYKGFSLGAKGDSLGGFKKGFDGSVEPNSAGMGGFTSPTRQRTLVKPQQATVATPAPTPSVQTPSPGGARVSSSLVSKNIR